MYPRTQHGNETYLCENCPFTGEDPCGKIKEMATEDSLYPNAACSNGLSPLACAVLKQDEKTLVSLLDYGADPDRKTYGGCTPMLLAKIAGFSGIVEIFERRIRERNADDIRAENAERHPQG